MAVSVQLQNLVKHFGNIRAVDHITLTIEPGELFFLLGPSGCGKTTLLRSIAGFNEPDSGTILIGERDVTRLPPHQRDTGMVFQSYALWPHMSVSQNVAFGLEMRKISKADIQERVKEALEMVRMTDWAGQKPNQLSGGQQQRVALARALVIHPQCLLLDEPLSNLDAKLRLEMRTEIRRICKESGLTAIYVTHDQKEALSVADRLAVLNGGVVEQCGAPREVYRRPVSMFAASFIGETNFIAGTFEGGEGGRVSVRTDLGTFVSTAPIGEFQVGQAVAVSLRPETLRLDDAPADAPNQLEGYVHNSVYLGEVAQHQVRVGTDRPLNLKVFDLNPRIIARDGEEFARIWVDPSDVVILPRGDADGEDS
ncbi:MAG: ABC transporter ATP-binding protein [Kiritimatiellae bacterium]|jgi:iron(III) transport system ATP-binding protein|nr:ABC transporter ATP-binding protein [Kiritimatiellia bacterium]